MKFWIPFWEINVLITGQFRGENPRCSFPGKSLEINEVAPPRYNFMDILLRNITQKELEIV